MPDTTLRIAGIAGSLRAGSFNRALLRAAQELAPAGMTIVVAEIGDLPLYNADVEAAGLPAPVVALKQAIQAADGLLIATPEYNYSIPGVLKNAIDWASRPPGKAPLNGKPAALMGATGGNWGTIRAQLALRQSLLFTETYLMLKPEMLVAKASEKFDAEGRLTDEYTREFLRKFLIAFEAWVGRMKA
ncbi:MAG: NAD(P)H-dependent oxidoreductase [Acidobacteriota bacterium]|nr:NAD(P)H-dependent oxidoreductase [Acidobacteriota bacterium]